MSVMLDIIESFFYSGMLLALVIKLNAFISTSVYESGQDIRAQQSCVQLGKIVESDFYKIGYYDMSGVPVRTASADTAKFYADIDNNGSIDSVLYYAGPARPSFSGGNPHHRVLYRKINAKPALALDLGVTSFKLSYYDSAGVKTTVLKSIRAVKVSMDVESAARNVAAGGSDTLYNSVHWQQYFVPKSLKY